MPCLNQDVHWHQGEPAPERPDLNRDGHLHQGEPALARLCQNLAVHSDLVWAVPTMRDPIPAGLDPVAIWFPPHSSLGDYIL